MNNYVSIENNSIFLLSDLGQRYRLESSYNDEFLDRWFEKNNTLENEVIIMFGLGTGMFLKKYLDNSKVGRIIIVEPLFDIYDLISKEENLLYYLEDDRCVIFLSDLKDREFSNFLYGFLSDIDDFKVKVAIYPNYNNVFPNETNRFIEIVDEACDMARAAVNVANRFGDAIRANIEKNTKRLNGSLSIKAFADRVPKDTPVVIAASGPSLNKNIDVLKTVKGRCLLVGLDSSLPALLKADIIPDVYVSIDPTKISRHFEDSRVKNIPAIAVLQSPEHVIKDGQKYFFIFNGDEEVLDELKEKSSDIVVVPPHGSVANTAFTLFNILGFKTFIFVGQDLAYTDNKYHADNTVHNEKTYKEDTVITLKGINGEEVKSSREFRMYKSGFEKVIQMFQDNIYIDSTEGGAYIEGTRVLSLKNTIEIYCNKNVNIIDCFENLQLLFNCDNYD